METSHSPAAPPPSDARTPPGTSGTLSVQLHSRRRRRGLAVQQAQHAVPAVALLFAGMRGLAEGPSGSALALAIVEVVTSGLLLATVARTFRQLAPSSAGHRAHAGSIGWAEIWVAGVLAAEAWERWHAAHHVARPTIMLAVVMLVLGLFHGRITRATLSRRALTLTDGRITVGGPPWRRFGTSWAELAEISVTRSEARLRTVSGKLRRIDFADLENAQEVRALLEVAQQRLAATIRTLPAEPEPSGAA